MNGQIAQRTGRGTVLPWLRKAVTQETDACVLWPFSDVKGYGCLHHDGRTRLATHVALELVGRSAPEPGHEEVRHLCGVSQCINPAHLSVGTRAENIADKFRLGEVVRGERHSGARLTEADVRAIRASRRRGRALAAQYGVSEQTICDIRARRTWAWLDDPPAATRPPARTTP